MAKKTTNSTVIDQKNTVTMGLLEKMIKTNVEAIMKDPDKSQMIPPILIHSAPGVGKSSLVRQIAKDLGIQYVDVRLAEMESVDIRGLPDMANLKIKAYDENGNEIEDETRVMRWAAPDFWPRDPDSAGIIFFDELTSAQRDSQVASYEIILDRKIGEFYKVPRKWYIVAAGNRAEDRAVATTMSSALANRFLHVEVRADAEEWAKWGQLNDLHPSVIGFINYRPGLLFNMEDENLERGWPSPRSWERVGRILDLYKGYAPDDPMIRHLVYGLVGDRAGVEFMEFYKINSNFDSVLRMMLGQTEVRIPESLDRKYAMCSAVSYLLWRGKDEADQKKRIDGFYKICNALSSDFASMLMVSAMTGLDKNNGTTYAKILFSHKDYKEFSEKHGKALRKRYQIG